MPSYSTLRLERRLEKAAKAFIAASGVAALTGMTAKERDETAVRLPQAETTKVPRLLFVAQDTGRERVTVIRTLRLGIEIRSNTKTAAGAVDTFDAECAALEQLLDSTNLKTALTSATFGINVMFARRIPGCVIEKENLNRTQTYGLEVKAVSAEMTAA